MALVSLQVGIPYADPWLRCWRDYWLSDDGPTGHRFDSYGLLGEPVEEKFSCIGSPAVEPECEFVEVIVEMLVSDAASMRTKQPAASTPVCLLPCKFVFRFMTVTRRDSLRRESGG